MRIASLAPSVTVMLQELGIADQIVACTHMCPLPKAQRAAMAVGTFSMLREEKLAATKPDIVFTATLVQAGGAQRLKNTGYTVIHFDPHRIEDIAHDYVRLGQNLNREQLAINIQKSFLEELKQYRQESKEINAPRVYMEEWHKPPYVSGNWVPDMVMLAGGVPVLSKPGDPSRKVMTNEIIAADPDLIIQHICLPPLLPEHTKQERQLRKKHRRSMFQDITARAAWQNITAVRNKALYTIDDSLLNMPTQNVLQGINKLRSILQKYEKK